MKPFKPIPCEEHQLKSNIIHKTMVWIIATGVTITLGLIGVIYASVNNRIDGKADKAVVEQMQKEVHDLWLMHLREGFKSTLEDK